MSEQHTVKLVLDPRAGHPHEHALNDLSEALGQQLGTPDESGLIEVTVEAPDEQSAIKQVIDAVAAAGVDDHFEIAEHP
jgi:hypothetical protein